ncbi:MAG: serine/threonine protein kinase, partial [Phototrophicales bacterium]
GFHDGVNNGPFKAEPNENKDEADIIWKFDMMAVFASFQHNMCSCSVTCYNDILLVSTSNGVDAGHINIPSPKAPSYFALNRDTGKVLWTDNSPGMNILHGQWSSPSYATIKG